MNNSMVNVRGLEENIDLDTTPSGGNTVINEQSPTQVHVVQHVNSKRLSPLGKTLMETTSMLQQTETKDDSVTKVIPGTAIATEEKEVEEELPIDPENNYQKVVCKHCVVRDMVGCDHCGLYIYGYRHKQFKFKATKI